MLIQIFRNNNPAFFVFIFLLTAAVFVPSLIGNGISSGAFNASVFDAVDYFLTDKSQIILFFNYCLLFILGIILVNMNSKYIIIEHRNYLPAIFFGLFAISFSESVKLPYTALISTMLIAATSNILEAYKKTKAIKNIFLAAMYISIATLVFPGAIYYLILIFIGIAIFRPFILREWMAVIFGAALPFLLLFSITYLLDHNIIIYRSYFFSNLSSGFDIFSRLSIFNYLFIGIYILAVMIGSYAIMVKSPVLKIKNKKYFQYFFFMFLISIALIFINPAGIFYYFTISFMPVAFLLAYYYSNTRPRFFTNFFFLIVLLACFVNAYGILF